MSRFSFPLALPLLLSESPHKHFVVDWHRRYWEVIKKAKNNIFVIKGGGAHCALDERQFRKFLDALASLESIIWHD